jgi:hypothetical protein
VNYSFKFFLSMVKSKLQTNLAIIPISAESSLLP